ncbi:MAG: lytic murein transglycosylase [Proteobacteria bacterium]|nr:MAG: lytic murein transglycosylase [Pseudomonadota bacterium]
MLAGILVLGFCITLPFWILSTPEERQSMVENTATIDVIEQSTGPLDILPETEKNELREMLQQPKETKGTVDFEQQVWEQDIRKVIQRWVPNEQEAQSIARWVYFYSVRFDLSPELMLSLISVESRFDHFAVSNVGARGLMQVMPFWKKELGSESDNLFEIETNIRYGSAILRYYIDRYKTLDRALAAYNGSLGKHKYPNKIFTQMRRFKATREDSI